MGKLRREVSALVELGLLFLPSIPALIWLWPNLSGTKYFDVVQSLVYVYFLCGALFIGLRRWSWSQLGLNRRGIGLSLVCGGVFIAERCLAQLALGLPLDLRPFGLLRVAGEVFFYFVLVGMVEELLFRGLLFRALEDWRGPALAIFGSSLGFALWHIGWAGPFIIVHFFVGIIFGLIRWRAGGIVGLIVIHGLDDFLAVETQTPVVIETLGQLRHIAVVHPAAVAVGDVLLLALILYLWKIHPRLQRAKAKNA
jgi:membrane protease YdiL (CAAX protease family)